MGNRQIAVLLLPLLWLLPAHLSMALEIQSKSDAINVAGKQRMYTMRMLRDHLMMGEHLTYKKPDADLKKTVAAFDEASAALESYLKDPDLQSDMAMIQKQWRSVRTMFDTPPKKEEALVNAKSVIAFREQLNTFVNHMAKKYGGGSAQVINHAGRLRAVSQALAAAYLLKSWGVSGANDKLVVPMKHFRESLDILDKAKETVSSMRPILTRLERTYLFFEVMDDADTTTTPVLAIKKTDKMLKDADALTKMYVEALKR